MMLGSLPIFTLPAPPSDGNLGPLPPAQLMYESEVDENKSQMSSALPASVATRTRTIGLIHPPLDIRTIVDKTAQFVPKNGPEFVKRFIISNAGNAEFNFLTASDPYLASYQHRLSEALAQPDHSVQSTVERTPLEPPEAFHYKVRLHEGITGKELDIMKLTKQFVARKGRSFLTGLTSWEMNSTLVDAYSKDAFTYISVQYLRDVFTGWSGKNHKSRPGKYLKLRS